MIKKEEEFFHVMEKIIKLLLSYNFKDGAVKLERKLHEYQRTDDLEQKFEILQTISNYYGGMGSINDIYFSQGDSNKLDADNKYLHELLNRLFDLTGIVQKAIRVKQAN